MPGATHHRQTDQETTVEINLIDVTPEAAAIWLRNNTRNRPISDRLVSEYARDMAAGAFLFNGEAIKIAEDQTLLDGQHRLAAVVRSGVTIKFLVIQGLPIEAQDTMDTGRRRTAGDQLAIHGEAYSRNLAAIARRVWQWEAGNTRFLTTQSPTNSEILATVTKHATLGRSAEVGHRIATSFRPSRSAVTGMAHHLFLDIDQNLTAQFFARLETGADLSKGHPVLTLRDRLTQDKILQRKIAYHQSVRYFIVAWNALREDREITLIKQAADGTSMPMPI